MENDKTIDVVFYANYNNIYFKLSVKEFEGILNELIPMNVSSTFNVDCDLYDTTYLFQFWTRLANKLPINEMLFRINFMYKMSVYGYDFLDFYTRRAVVTGLSVKRKYGECTTGGSSSDNISKRYRRT
jgi:hypothetical protein